jgi:pimeloyl-ACP methyl ester carboxylesterase
MLAATRAVNAPVLLLYAQNDYSVVPGKDMSAELTRLNKPNELKIYPPVGSSTADGHRAVYGAVEVWEKDVFAFLDQHVR